MIIVRYSLQHYGETWSPELRYTSESSPPPIFTTTHLLFPCTPSFLPCLSSSPPVFSSFSSSVLHLISFLFTTFLLLLIPFLPSLSFDLFPPFLLFLSAIFPTCQFNIISSFLLSIPFFHSSFSLLPPTLCPAACRVLLFTPYFLPPAPSFSLPSFLPFLIHLLLIPLPFFFSIFPLLFYFPSFLHPFHFYTLHLPFSPLSFSYFFHSSLSPNHLYCLLVPPFIPFSHLSFSVPITSLASLYHYSSIYLSFSFIPFSLLLLFFPYSFTPPSHCPYLSPIISFAAFSPISLPFTSTLFQWFVLILSPPPAPFSSLLSPFSYHLFFAAIPPAPESYWGAEGSRAWFSYLREPGNPLSWPGNVLPPRPVPKGALASKYPS